MLFPYTYVAHSMDEMQHFIDYIFYKVWYRANSNQSYSFDLFNKKWKLKQIMIDFHYSETVGGDLFNRTVEDVYIIFQTLTRREKRQIKQWYQSNNNIQKLCASDGSVTPVTYVELEAYHEELARVLKRFFPKLYGKDIIGLKAVYSKIGKIEDHYDKFITINGEGVCPFCGINDIDGGYVHTREAYDHYLPKEKYPFNSINFKNLAPMCNKCNSSNKLRQNPLINPTTGERRKSFYPYCEEDYTIDISLSFNTDDIKNIKEEDISVTTFSNNIEAVNTWKEVFFIDERYKQKCASKAHGKYWYTQIIDELKDIPKAEALRKKYNQMNESPFADTNFLRKPFLEACEKKGLFDD